AEGCGLSQDVPTPFDARANLELASAPSATRDYIESRLSADDLVIRYARSPQAYRGQEALAARAGHIPGAINHEWTAAKHPTRAMRIREDIAEQLLALGISPDKEIITHCQTHHRSGFTYLLAKALGYPCVKGYPGSWGEWGNLPDTPIQQ